MTDGNAITERIPSSSDIGDFTQQEENDLKVGTRKQSLTPHENEDSPNSESSEESGSEDQQADPNRTNPRSVCGSELGPSRDSELGPNVDSDALPMRTTGKESLIGMETGTNAVNDQAGVIGEQSTASMESTGCSETPKETFNHQRPISPQASEIAFALEEENLAKVENPKTADSEDEKACGMSPEHREISQSNHGADDSPDSVASPHSTDAAVPPEIPNPSPRLQVEHKLTNADALQPADTSDGKPLEDQQQTEDVGQNDSLQGVRGDSGADDSSECVPVHYPIVAVASDKHRSSSRIDQGERSLTNAVHLQLADTNNGKPPEDQGQGVQDHLTEDVGHSKRLYGVRGDLEVEDSFECAQTLNPTVGGAVATAKDFDSSQRDEKLTSAGCPQPAGTNNGIHLEDQSQTEDVGYYNSSHGAQEDLGVDDSSECVTPANPTVAGAVASAQHPSSRRRVQVENKLTNADHLQSASTNKAKPVEYQGPTEDFRNNYSLQGVRGDLGADKCLEKSLTNADHLQPASTNNGKPLGGQGQTDYLGQNNMSHGGKGDSRVDNSSECAQPLYPTVAGAPRKHAKSSKQAQVEKKPTNADHLQSAGSNNANAFEYQGQSSQAFSTEGVSHYKNLNDVQVDWGVDDSSECVPPIYFVSPSKYSNPNRGPQAELKPTNAYRSQLTGSRIGKPPEDQGQGLQQGHRKEGVGRMTSAHSMSVRTSPPNPQQPFAGAKGEVYQIDQAGYASASLAEYVQPQSPHIRTKDSKLSLYDGGRPGVHVTQDQQPPNPKPANKGGITGWHLRCIKLSTENDNLEMQVKSYSTQMLAMKQQIQDSALKLEQAQEIMARLNKQISKYEQQHAQEIHKSGSYLDDSKAATPALLVSALNGVKDASNNFAKAFKAQVDSLHPTKKMQIEQILSKCAGQVSRNGHIKFQYQAHVCQRLFEGFDHRNFDVFESTAGLPVATVEHCFRQYQMHDFKKSDTVERLFQHHPEIDTFLHVYCFKNFSKIFNREFEEQLFDGRREHSNAIEHYGHPCNSRFYRSFCKLAVSIWLVHRLAFSFIQPAKLFCPSPGMAFNTSSMQSVVPLDPASDDEELEWKVGFCVIPGMKVGECIVPSEVYVIGG